MSSTAISNYLLEGDIISANNLLGESYRYTGVVSHGHAVGRNLGFATANIPIKDDIIILKDGVYIGYCEFDNKRYKTMINIGSRITFNDIF